MEAQARALAYAFGASFAAKPTDPELLLSIVEAALREPPPGDSGPELDAGAVDLLTQPVGRLTRRVAERSAQLEVALDHPDGLDWTETARDVHADTLRLARLTEDLLLLARLDEHHLRLKPTDLAALCESVAARYATARVPVRADAPSACLVLGRVGFAGIGHCATPAAFGPGTHGSVPTWYALR